MDLSSLTPEQARSILAKINQSNKIIPTENDIYSYLKSKNITDNHIAGLISNIKSESNLDPYNETGDGGSSIGLFQHHNERADALKNKYGSDWTNWKNQIDFALSEPEGLNYISQKFSSPEEASKWFTVNFERPKDAAIKANERISNLPNQNQMQQPITPEQAASLLSQTQKLKDEQSKQSSLRNEALPVQRDKSLLEKIFETGTGDTAHFSPLLTDNKNGILKGFKDYSAIQFGDKEGIKKYLSNNKYNVQEGDDGRLYLNGKEVDPSFAEDSLSRLLHGKIPGSNLGDIAQLAASIPSIPANLPSNIPVAGTTIRNIIGKTLGTREGDIVDSENVINTLFDLVTFGLGSKAVRGAVEDAGKYLYTKGANLGRLKDIADIGDNTKVNKAVTQMLEYNLPAREKPFYQAAFEKMKEVGSKKSDRLRQIGNVNINPFEEQARKLPYNPSIGSENARKVSDIVENKIASLNPEENPFVKGKVNIESVPGFTMSNPEFQDYDSFKNFILQKIEERKNMRKPVTGYSTALEEADPETELIYRANRALKETGNLPVKAGPSGVNQETLPPNWYYNALTDENKFKDTDNLGDLLQINTNPQSGQGLGVFRGDYYRNPTEDEIRAMYDSAKNRSLNSQISGPEIERNLTTDASFLDKQKTALQKKYENEGLLNETNANMSDILRNILRENDLKTRMKIAEEKGIPLDALESLDEINRQYHALSESTNTTKQLYDMANNPLMESESIYSHLRPGSMPNIGFSGRIFENAKTPLRYAGQKLYNFGKNVPSLTDELALTSLERLLATGLNK